MVTQVTSSTKPDTEYNVTIEHGQAIHCTCIGHSYGKTCRHMKSVNADIAAEIAKAARFLAVKREVQGMEETWKANRQIFYSEW